MYPNSTDITFDMEYYAKTHIPMVQQLLGEALKKTELEVGISGAAPSEPAPFVAIANLYFETLESFQTSFGPHVATIVADTPNYSNVQGEIQIGKIV